MNLFVAFAEEVRHHRDVLVARVVEARKLESGFHRLQQREAIVVVSALNAVLGVVRLNGEDNLVLVLRGEQAVGRSGDSAVIVLVLDDDDRAAVVVPNWRGLDGLDQTLEGHPGESSPG